MELKLKNAQMYYDIRGEGHPIVMIPGFSLDHQAMVGAFEPIFRYRPGWKRIYLDMPGHGRSPGQDWITGSDQMLDVLVDLVNNVIPGQPFSIAGFSYGGYLARGLLYRKFSQVDGLLLLTPTITPGVEKRDLPPPTVLMKDEAEFAKLPQTIQETLAGNVVIQTRRVLDRVRTEIAHGVMNADYTFLGRLREKYTFSFDVNDLPGPFTHPVLILTGRHDAVTGYRDAVDLVKQYPRSTYVVLDRAGHGLHLEQEQLFNALVTEWVDRVEEMSHIEMAMAAD